MAENESNQDGWTTVPASKEELIQRIQSEWSALEQTISQLSEERMMTADPGGWSPKDNLAHLAAWERFMLGYHLQDRSPHEVMGVDADTFEAVDEDGLNAILYQRNKDRPLIDVLADFRQTHQEVLETLEGLPFDTLMEQHYPDDPEARPRILWVIGNTYEHYREHHRNIRVLIE